MNLYEISQKVVVILMLVGLCYVVPLWGVFTEKVERKKQYKKTAALISTIATLVTIVVLTTLLSNKDAKSVATESLMIVFVVASFIPSLLGVFIYRWAFKSGMWEWFLDAIANWRAARSAKLNH